MGSQLQACDTMWSVFRPSSKKKDGEEGDKHNNNATERNTLVL